MTETESTRSRFLPTLEVLGVAARAVVLTYLGWALAYTLALLLDSDWTRGLGSSGYLYVSLFALPVESGS